MPAVAVSPVGAPGTVGGGGGRSRRQEEPGEHGAVATVFETVTTTVPRT